MQTMAAGSSSEPSWMTDELRGFRRTVRALIETRFVPHVDRWRANKRPDRAAWAAAGQAGLLLASVPETFGGGGGTAAHDAVVIEELARAGIQFGVGPQNYVAWYILKYGSDEQKRRWLPRMARGELVGAIALTEPGAGSDVAAIQTTAQRHTHDYIVNGTKKLINNGALADLVCLLVKTAPDRPAAIGMSLLVAETHDLPGYCASQPFDKIGMHEQDTCELFFDEVRVPAANLLGTEGQGFTQIVEQLPYERLMIAVSAIATAERALALTTRHARERRAFGGPLMDLQHTRFTLADCATHARVGRVFLDDCVRRFLGGTLDGATAAMAKSWLTDCEWRVLDACLQLHGGLGYVLDSPIARMWVNARAPRIYGGANEVLKELIASSL